DVGERAVGIDDRTFFQLASADVAVTHDGLPVLWTEARPASSGQREFSHHQFGAAVIGVAADDGRVVAQRGGGGAVCVASVACGIGGVGGGTQRRSQHAVLDADTVDVCAVC